MLVYFNFRSVASDLQLGSSQFATCLDPKLFIVVISYNRPDSLMRLFNSISKAQYGCASVDLHITIDYGEGSETSEVEELSLKFEWKHGRKFVQRRLQNVGLRTSWFESVYQYDDFEYVAFLEDDMEVSSQFYKLFRSVEANNEYEKKHHLCVYIH